MNKRLFLYILSVFTLLGCNNHNNQFTLEGEFANLEQGEFFIYSHDNANNKIDTLKINKGNFEFVTQLNNNATFFLLMPNMTEIVIFAQPGENVKIKGDARELKKTEVYGSDDNELMTEFRMSSSNLNIQQTAKLSADFIRQHPESQVSLYLIKQLLLNNNILNSNKGNINADSCLALIKLIEKKQPHNPSLKEWYDIINKDKLIKKGKKLPHAEFKDINNNIINTDSLRGKHTLICFWASWDSSAPVTLQRIRNLKKQYKDKLNIITVALDTDHRQMYSNNEQDSIKWIQCCDYKAWQSETVKAFNVNNIPFAVLADKNGIITALGHDLQNDVIEHINKNLE